MSGKGKKSDKDFEFGFITHIDLDEFGRRKKITLQSEPHDTLETIEAHLAAFSSDALPPVTTSASSPSSSILLSEAIEDFVRAKRVQTK